MLKSGIRCHGKGRVELGRVKFKIYWQNKSRIKCLINLTTLSKFYYLTVLSSYIYCLT